MKTRIISWNSSSFAFLQQTLNQPYRGIRFSRHIPRGAFAYIFHVCPSLAISRKLANSISQHIYPRYIIQAWKAFGVELTLNITAKKYNQRRFTLFYYSEHIKRVPFTSEIVYIAMKNFIKHRVYSQQLLFVISRVSAKDAFSTEENKSD